jgi:hypothetical protein
MENVFSSLQSNLSCRRYNVLQNIYIVLQLLLEKSTILCKGDEKNYL